MTNKSRQQVSDIILYLKGHGFRDLLAAFFGSERKNTEQTFFVKFPIPTVSLSFL